MRRDRPTFDDVEAPEVRPSKVDGLTDEEWAERRIRRERNVRVAWGLAVGAFVGALSVWRWGLARALPGVAATFIVGGSMTLFAALFAHRRDEEAVAYAGWVAFPEWMLVERAPWWLIAMIAAAGVAVFGFLIAGLVIAYFPQGR